MKNTIGRPRKLTARIGNALLLEANTLTQNVIPQVVVQFALGSQSQPPWRVSASRRRALSPHARSL